jgi:hypothetical protein
MTGTSRPSDISLVTGTVLSKRDLQLTIPAYCGAINTAVA